MFYLEKSLLVLLKKTPLLCRMALLFSSVVVVER